MAPPSTRTRGLRDSLASVGSTGGYSLALGLATVAIPLMAVQAGYSGTEIGVLTALSALVQMATRVCMGAAMRRLPDWTFITMATVLMTGSCALLTLSTAYVPFIVAQSLQGVSRAFFWTGSQTHAVRVSASSVGGLASVNLFSSIGLLAGPSLAGVLTEHSATLALGVGAGIAAAATIPTFLLTRLPPFAPPADRHPGRIWRRPGVDVGCLAGVTAGAWRGLLSSYVPVVLDAARQNPSTIGVLVSVANAASVAGVGVVSRVKNTWMGRAHAIGVLAAGIGTGAVAPLAGYAWPAAVALAVSGLGAGALQTVGPAIAADAVHPEERGEAIASAGTFRAGALFAAPLGVAGLVVALPLTWSMVAISVLIAAPAGLTRRMHARTAAQRPAE